LKYLLFQMLMNVQAIHAKVVQNVSIHMAISLAFVRLVKQEEIVNWV